MEKRINILLTMVITVFIFLQMTSVPALGEPVWEPAPPLQRPRAGPGVTVGLDGLIYAIGGVDQGYGMGHVTNTVERFDESSNSWEYVTSMGEERHGPGAVTDSQGHIWVLGGINKSDGFLLFDSVEVYDPDANYWTFLPARLNTARYQFGIGITEDDRIYVFGGIDSDFQILSSVEMYDPATGLWRDDVVPDMKEPRAGLAFTMDEQGRIYAIGGGNLVSELKTVERYDHVSNEWEYVADLPEARGASAAFTLNGEIWFVGGWLSGYTNACYIYSPDTNTWRDGPPMYEGLGLAGTAIGFSGTAYIIGGERSAGWPSDHVAMLVPQVKLVDIDIKPGSYPNAINLGSHGLIPIAIFSEVDFDATTVNPDTVELAGADVAVRGKSNKFMAHKEDVDGDGLVDLLVQVATANLDPNSLQDGSAILTAKTYDDQNIEGEDDITIVPPEK